jgi:hypothetical protein
VFNAQRLQVMGLLIDDVEGSGNMQIDHARHPEMARQECQHGMGDETLAGIASRYVGQTSRWQIAFGWSLHCHGFSPVSRVARHHRVWASGRH